MFSSVPRELCESLTEENLITESSGNKYSLKQQENKMPYYHRAPPPHKGGGKFYLSHVKDINLLSTFRFLIQQNLTSSKGTLGPKLRGCHLPFYRRIYEHVSLKK